MFFELEIPRWSKCLTQLYAAYQNRESLGLRNNSVKQKPQPQIVIFFFIFAFEQFLLTPIICSRDWIDFAKETDDVQIELDLWKRREYENGWAEKKSAKIDFAWIKKKV